MKPLFKVKLNITIYRDFDEWYWDTYNPKYDFPSHRVWIDYEMLRKGQILEVYNYCDYNGYYDEDEARTVICRGKRGNLIYFESMEDLLNCSWFDEVK